jgi:hypothetical protein
MRTVHTTAGSVRIVTLKQFINKYCTRKSVKDDLIEYNHRTHASVSTYFQDGAIQLKTHSDYERKVIILHKEELRYFRADLINASSYLPYAGGTPIETIEEVAVTCAHEFMEPELLVQLGKRTYVAVDTHEVCLLLNDEGLAALMCYQAPVHFRIPATK